MRSSKYNLKAYPIWSNMLSSSYFFMPHKRKSVMASIQNGKRSREDREVKRQRTEDSRIIADKENGVSPCHSRHNLKHYLRFFSDRPSKPSKEHSDKKHIIWSNDHWFLSDGDQNTILQVLRLIQFTPDGHKDLSLFNKLIYLYKLGLKCI